MIVEAVGRREWGTCARLRGMRTLTLAASLALVPVLGLAGCTSSAIEPDDDAFCAAIEQLFPEMENTMDALDELSQAMDLVGGPDGDPELINVAGEHLAETAAVTAALFDQAHDAAGDADVRDSLAEIDEFFGEGLLELGESARDTDNLYGFLGDLLTWGDGLSEVEDTMEGHATTLGLYTRRTCADVDGSIFGG